MASAAKSRSSLRASRNPTATIVSGLSGWGVGREGGAAIGKKRQMRICRGGHTNISSAVSDGLLSKDMVSEADRMFEKLDLFVMAGSKNGLRDSGRGGGSSKGETGLCEVEGETARLRKGLFEERFNKPEDRWSKNDAQEQSVPGSLAIRQERKGNELGLGRAVPCM